MDVEFNYTLSIDGSVEHLMIQQSPAFTKLCYKKLRPDFAE